MTAIGDKTAQTHLFNQTPKMRKITLAAVLTIIVTNSDACFAGDEAKPLSSVNSKTPSFDPSVDPPSSETIIIQDGNQGGVPSRFWGSAEYLMWWPRSGTTPAVLAGVPQTPTLTTSTSPLPPFTGLIGLYTIGSTPPVFNPNLGTLAAGGSYQGLQSGGRFSVGYWLDPEQHFGIEGGYFFLGLGQNSPAASNGSPSLVIPYFNAGTGQAAAYTIAQQPTTTSISQFVNTTPGVFVHLFDTTTTTASTGNVSVRSSGNLQAFDANGIYNALNTDGWRLDLLAGFRYAALNENLIISSSVTTNQSITTVFEPALNLTINGQPILDATATVNSRTDAYNARNSFYGGQIGVRNEFMFDRFSLFVGAQVGLGNMSESLLINGYTDSATISSITPTMPLPLAGIPLTVPTGAAAVTSKTVTQTIGGFFAQPGNIGSYHRNVFAVMPEGDFKVAYRITDNITGTIGYSFVYMSSVVRPGDQVDRIINPTLLTSPTTSGVAKSTFAMASTEFWAQGLTFGVAFRY